MVDVFRSELSWVNGQITGRIGRGTEGMYPDCCAYVFKNMTRQADLNDSERSWLGEDCWLLSLYIVAIASASEQS